MSKSYKYAGKINDMELMARVSGDMGIVYHSTGVVSKALDYFNNSLDISRKISVSRGFIAASINLGILYLDKGLFRKAEALFTDSLAITKETASLLYECAALTNLGDIAYERGGYQTAEGYYNESANLARTINAPVEEGINLIGTARVQLKQGLFNKSAENLENGVRLLREADEMQYISDYYLYKGSLELLQDNIKEAGLMAKKALETAEECRNDRKKLKALRLKGYILIKKADYPGAANAFDKAVELAEEIDSDYEKAKGYYGRYLICRDMDSKGAQQALDRASEALGRIDDCRWSSMVNSEMEKLAEQ
jgi:tetratricopeptide (TPR) repeat protein